MARNWGQFRLLAVPSELSSRTARFGHASERDLFLFRLRDQSRREITGNNILRRNVPAAVIDVLAFKQGP